MAMRAGSGSRARDGPCVSLSGLRSPLAAGSVSAMAGFPVPRYPAETAGRDRGVARWIPGLPVIVAGLAGRWSLRVGEPFQPGGQCSWTAPVTGPRSADLVLKIAFRFPGGEERAEAAALAAQPEPWLVIDPKPYVGDPAYDLLLHMLNCEDRLAAHPAGWPTGWRHWPGLTPTGCGSGIRPRRAGVDRLTAHVPGWRRGSRPPDPPPPRGRQPGS